MNNPIRAIALGASFFCASAVPFQLNAQTNYPAKPIRIIVGQNPGTGTDASARSFAQRLTALLGQPVIIDNKGGAHGFIGGTAAKDAEKDGYTLMIAAGGTMAVNPGLYGKKMPFDPVKDFEPVGIIEQGPVYLAVSNNLPVKNVKDLVAYAGANPGKVNYGTGGNGTTSHLAMELLKRSTGMQAAHIPYRGSNQVVQDLIGGQIQTAFDAAIVLIPQAKAGKIRIIGVASGKRSAALPDVPSVQEQGFPGFEAKTWSALYAPAGTPAPIVQKLNEALNKIVRSDDFREYLKASASEAGGGTSEDHKKFLATEIAKWATVIKEANIQPD
ncbi:tripartite tricarboxylate transporter substrate binding protein [Variovorax rhizosphaerae]|uniref:Tripartite tricarboxylate transporter substrate binding protein n=1 Tax=Variovorax rhizosphaerae TaxID=1836200 RepID=A0ABU8X0Z5_9BURK